MALGKGNSLINLRLSEGVHRVHYIVVEEKQKLRLKYYILCYSRISGMRMNNEVISENADFVVS